jgi:hypothetical protein
MMNWQRLATWSLSNDLYRLLTTWLLPSVPMLARCSPMTSRGSSRLRRL